MPALWRLLVVFVLAWPSAMAAQIRQPGPDCNLARRAGDNPFTDRAGSGWYMRRYEWHAFYIGAAFGISEALHQTTGWQRRITAFVPAIGIGLVPHVRGAVRHTYAIDPLDWTFDAYRAAIPLLLTMPKKQSIPVIVLGYVALACFASP